MTTITITLTQEQIKAIETQTQEKSTSNVLSALLAFDDLLEFVSETDIRLKGHRIWLEHVVALYQEGLSAEAIRQKFSGVAPEKIYAAITYYLANKTAVDDYLRRLEQQAEQTASAQAETAAGQRLLEIVGEAG